MVGEQHGDRTREHRHHEDEQVGGDQPGPAEERHVQQAHPRGAHVHDRDDHVDGAEDRRDAHEVDREDREREAVTGLQRQRRIERPATRRGAARDEQREQQQREGERQQPEAEVVETRQRHVGRAELQRHHPVGETGPGRHHGAEDHQQRVHGRHRVVERRVEELHTGLEEFEADEQRHRTAEEEQHAGEHQVHRADVLVVGRVEPTLQALRLVVVGVVGVVVCGGVGHVLSLCCVVLFEVCGMR